MRGCWEEGGVRGVDDLGEGGARRLIYGIYNVEKICILRYRVLV